MPNLTGSSSELIAWLTAHGLALLLIAVALLFAYRWTRPAIHRVLVRVMETQARTLGADPGHRADVEPRGRSDHPPARAR